MCGTEPTALLRRQHIESAAVLSRPSSITKTESNVVTSAGYEIPTAMTSMEQIMKDMLLTNSCAVKTDLQTAILFKECLEWGCT